MQVKQDKKAEKFLKKSFSDHSLEFRCFNYIPEDCNEVFTYQIIELHQNNSPVGFIKLMYYDRDNSVYALNNALDYFAVLKSNKNCDSWFKEQNENFFNQFGYSNPVRDISEQYHQEHKNFMQLWDKKPTVELVRVYSDSDNISTSHSQYPPLSSNREPFNFKSQGFGKQLYLAAALLMKQKKMSIYSSFKQTTDGQNMWKSIEKNPQFLLSCETISKKIQGKNSPISRSFFTI